MDKTIIPFVKWAGGKRQLLEHIARLMPKHYGDYYEPFIGGGAVFMHFQPQTAHLNDINRALINCYEQIRDDYGAVLEKLDQLDNSVAVGGKDFYYMVRDDFNDRMMREAYDSELATEFIFLNKHCFNGLYRVNHHGRFNVPYNGSIRRSYDRGNIERLAYLLRQVDISCCDFEQSVAGASTGDFIFFDSPYAPLNPTSFENYTKEGFDKESHIRLATLFRNLTDKGCYCMLTNHNTEFIHDLYDGFNCKVVAVKRMINRDAGHRVSEEVIITNYKR